jgi:hypothetical protein
MAKKKGLAAYKKRAKKNSSIVRAKANPPPLQDVLEFVVPGFAGYAGTRMVSRIVHGMVIKRYPKFAKHASVLSTAIAATGAWFLAHRIDKVKQYHTPIVVGAGIATIQTVVQAYLPKYGWMVSDHNLAAQTPAQAALPPAPRSSNGAPASAPVYNSQTNPGELPPPIASLTPAEISDELDDLDMGSLSSGFSMEGGGISDFEMDSLIDDATIN